MSRPQGPGRVAHAGLRAWSLRVVFIEQRGRWWWNAWREQTATELYGFADDEQAARDAMYAAIDQAPPWPAPPAPPRPDRSDREAGRYI